jgi:hypothetical protein
MFGRILALSSSDSRSLTTILGFIGPEQKGSMILCNSIKYDVTFDKKIFVSE